MVQHYARARKLVQLIASRILRKSKARARTVHEDRVIAVPFGWIPNIVPSLRTAVMVHMFYPEMAYLFRTVVDNIPSPCDILITTNELWKEQEISSAFAGWSKGEVFVRIVPNRGRDIAPKLTAFRHEYPTYELILFLHSKKTERGELGGRWLDSMMSQLCGSPEIVQSIQYLFTVDPTLGMVSAKHFSAIRPYLHWRDNESFGKLIARKLGLKLNVDGVLDFPSGSFFWARPGALQPLLDLGLGPEDFAPEAGQLRGTIAHAIERLFFVVCEVAGYSWVKVGDPKFAGAEESLIYVAAPGELVAARDDADFRVSATMLK